MIDTKLLDLLNSGNAWVFVGSGLSIESGLPAWPDLVNLTLEQLPADKKQAINADRRFLKGRTNSDIPACFQRMQTFVGQSIVVELVREIISQKTTSPGDLTKLVTDWPAAGYLTTNYDHFIEAALNSQQLSGWIPIGNSPNEIRKVSGDVKDIVWHVHGSTVMPDTASTLIIGTKEYDDLYLDNSPLQQQLKSFLTQRRLVFVGFGLRDPEIMRLLKLAGRYTTPERPIYAFLGSRNIDHDQDTFTELRDQYNIDVQPYRIDNGSHDALRDLLEFYSSMIVRRSVKYNQLSTTVPSYDPDATGLLIYNTLVLQAPAPLENETLRSLLTARILSLIEHRTSITSQDIITEISQIVSKPHDDAELVVEVQSVLSELKNKDLIAYTAQGNPTAAMILTPAGHSFVSERAGVAERIRDQFRASLDARTADLVGESSHAKEVTDAAASFFEDCIEKRSLGVAMALNAADTLAQEYQMVALMQALPQFFGRLSSPESAKALVKVIQGVLSEPTEAESKHCGLLLQARLGVHLLGVDKHTLSSRTRALKNMVFVLDSTSLIPLIAVSGKGHHAAMELMRRLKRIGATAVTTRNLIVEVSEHAAYASRKVSEAGGAISASVLHNLIGKEGQSPNVFLDGFIEESAAGSLSNNDFRIYMQRSCGFGAIPITDEGCDELIGGRGVKGIDLPKTEGYVEEHHAEIEQLKTQIEERRRQSSNFRHERQVLAEAEVVVLIQKLRNNTYTIGGRSFDGGYFVSNSRFIDQLNSVGLPVTIRQNVLLQWLGTVAPFEESELHVLMDGLLWELSERGFEFVNRKRLRTAFSSTVSASKEEYDSIVDQHKTLIATEWGMDPEYAFQEPVDELDIASLVSRHTLQTIDRQQKELERVKASAGRDQSSRELSQNERVQFERLKSEKANRIQKNRRRAKNRSTRSKKRRRDKRKG